jgi:hypothetical protein
VFNEGNEQVERRPSRAKAMARLELLLAQQRRANETLAQLNTKETPTAKRRDSTDL